MIKYTQSIFVLLYVQGWKDSYYTGYTLGHTCVPKIWQRWLDNYVKKLTSASAIATLPRETQKVAFNNITNKHYGLFMLLQNNCTSETATITVQLDCLTYFH